MILLVGGMHLSPKFGNTWRAIEEEGFTIAGKLEWIRDGADVADEAGAALPLVAQALQAHRAGALLVVGDRYETAAAALGAVLARVPIVHLHGGEETAGAIDNVLRHAITKLSHLHFTSHPAHTERVIALGEDPATVHTVGAPGIDNLWRADLPTREELQRLLGLNLAAPLVVVTMQPATLGAEDEAAAVADAMDCVPGTYVVTLPNSDSGAARVRETMRRAAAKPGRISVEALGERNYWGLLRVSDALLGNSSSALIEAPAVGLPAVNVGDRQLGRRRGGNVIDAAVDSAAIADALRRALSPDFRRLAAASPSPFGDGHASEKIVATLKQWTPPNPPRKRSVGA